MSSPIDPQSLATDIKTWGSELGFDQLGIASTELDQDEVHLLNWLGEGRDGEMRYMRRHGSRRSRPAELVPGTTRVISARMDYWPESSIDPFALLEDPTRAYISRYALGRDYHKVLRSRLRSLASRIENRVGTVWLSSVCGQRPGAGKRPWRGMRVWVGSENTPTYCRAMLARGFLSVSCIPICRFQWTNP